MPDSVLVLTCTDPLLTRPDSFRTLVFVSMSYDWHHPAAACSSLLALSRSYHGPGLDLSQLPPLPCPIICLFWPRSAAVGSSLGFAVLPHALFHFLPIAFLALSGSACHVPSYWHRMRQCIIGNCQFLLVSCLSSKSQPFHSEPHKLLDSSQWTGHLSVFFHRSQKNQ